MFLPKNKYKIKFSKGQFTGPDGKRYIGPYIETYDGKYFKGNNLLKAVEPLTDTGFSLTKPTVNFYYPKPTEEDYTKGSFTRYVVREDFNSKVKEVDKKTYIALGNVPGYTRTEVQWKLIGAEEGTKLNGKDVKPAKEYNEEEILRQEQNLKGVSSILTDPLQFVRFIKPDISSTIE